MSIKIFLSGCHGRMGQTIQSMSQENQEFVITAGSDIQGKENCPFPVYTRPADCREPVDVIVDFSNPSALPALCELIEKRNIPSVICTTGFDQTIKDKLFALSKQCPLFLSANMSLGINALIRLACQAATILYPEFDIEITEAHHNQKIDAPSGTALMIADAIKDTVDDDLTYVYDRSTIHEKRSKKEIGMQSIRGGTIVGEHTVLFAGPEEHIEIRHFAQSRAVFARGALAATRFLIHQSPGLYTMTDLVKSRL